MFLMINFPYQLICHFDNFHCSRSQMFQQNVSDLLWSSHLKSGRVRVEAVTLIARLMGPAWGPPGANRSKVGPMLAPSTLLSGNAYPIFYGVLIKARTLILREDYNDQDGDRSLLETGIMFCNIQGFYIIHRPTCDTYVHIAWSKAVLSEYNHFCYQTCSPCHLIKTLGPDYYCPGAKIEPFYVGVLLYFLSWRLCAKKRPMLYFEVTQYLIGHFVVSSGQHDIIQNQLPKTLNKRSTYYLVPADNLSPAAM